MLHVSHGPACTPSCVCTHLGSCRLSDISKGGHKVGLRQAQPASSRSTGKGRSMRASCSSAAATGACTHVAVTFDLERPLWLPAAVDTTSGSRPYAATGTGNTAQETAPVCKPGKGSPAANEVEFNSAVLSPAVLRPHERPACTSKLRQWKHAQGQQQQAWQMQERVQSGRQPLNSSATHRLHAGRHAVQQKESDAPPDQQEPQLNAGVDASQQDTPPQSPPAATYRSVHAEIRSDIKQLIADLAKLPKHVSSAAVLDGIPLNGEEITCILTELAKKRRPDRALATFAWFEQSPQYNVNSCVLYTRMISILGRDRRYVHLAIKVLDRMEARRIQPDLMCYNAAINVAGKALQFGRAERLYQQMLRAGFEPTVYTYTSLIAACQKTGRWQQAWHFFHNMQQAGVVPNVKTYTTLMSASTRAGQWQMAIEAFEEMEAAGLQPDVVTYNSAISACAAGGQWEKAWALFGNMKRLRIQPSVRSYNALISACEKAEQPERALEVFANMQRTARNGRLQLQPTAVTYNTLLLACGKAGRFADTMRLYGEMQAAGLQGDAFTLTALLTACERMGKWEQALQYLDQFQEDGVAPNIHHQNCLLSAFSRAEQWEKAVDKLQEVKEQPGMQLDAVSYSTVISACQRCQQSELALQLFDEMLEANLLPNGYLFATLISACEQKADWRRAFELFESMKALDVDAPSVSMAARRVMYAWPQLLEAMPQSLVTAAYATVNSGRAARRWLDKR